MLCYVPKGYKVKRVIYMEKTEVIVVKRLLKPFYEKIMRHSFYVVDVI